MVKKETRGNGGGMIKHKSNTPSKNKRRPQEDDDLSEDEVEAFHRQKIESLDTRDLGSDGSDDDEEFSEDDKEVLGLAGSNSDDDDEDDVEDDDESEEDDEEKTPFDRRGLATGGDDSDDSDDGDVLDRVTKQWGKTSSAYYKQGDENGGDDDDDDEMDGDAAEEEEAIRLQREQALTVSNDDFALDSGSSKKKSAKKSAKKKSKKSKKRNESEDESESEEEEAQGGTVQLIRSSKTDKGSSSALDRVMADAPELVALLAEFKDKTKDLEQFVGPICEKVKSGKLATKQGVSYLEAKLHVLLSYNINIAFYLMLKAEGRSVSDHPVISQLVRCRTIMEKLRPLDAQLKQQLESLFRQAGSSTSAGSKDSAMRPSIDDLEGSDSDDEDAAANKSQASKSGESSSAGKYVVPKMSAMPFEEQERLSKKRDKKHAKNQEKLKNSKMLEDIRDEFSSKPREQSGVGADQDHDDLRKEDDEIRNYEEENFVRLVETKKQKKERRRRERSVQNGIMNSMADLEDLQGLESLVKAGAKRRKDGGGAFDSLGPSAGDGDDDDAFEAELPSRKRGIDQFVHNMEAKQKGREKRVKSGDADLPIRDKEAMARNRKKSVVQNDPEDDAKFGGGDAFGNDDEAMYNNDNAMDDVSGDEFYEQARKSQQSRKSDKAAQYTHPEKELNDPADIVMGNNKRSASRRMLKNKGLQPHKKKEARNPRVVLKNKYKKKVKARKGQVRDVRTGEAATYAGESTGIKTNVVRSRKPGKM